MFKTEIREDMADLFGDNSAHVLIGDLNCKSTEWDSSVTNRWGRQLSDLAVAHKATVIKPDCPTYLPAGSGKPDVLDNPILKNVWVNVKLSQLLQKGKQVGKTIFTGSSY